jgi:hypothetical protein
VQGDAGTLPTRMADRFLARSAEGEHQMSRRIAELLSSKRRRRLLLATTASLAVLGALVISNALAVHDLGLFELDRNATDDTAQGEDWSTLYANGANTGGSSIAFTKILPDILTPTDSGDQFQGGGSKDNNDINQWLWKTGEPLDKDDITNAYAAAYTIPTGGGTGQNQAGDTIVYFGLDRFDNSGAAQVGFWFLKNQISETNTPSGGGFTFSGVHANGDILVQSNFSQGGVIASVTVYEWLNGSLQQLTSGQDCNPQGAATDEPVCATVNQSSTPSPWPYTPKSGPANAFPQGAFFEGGINITRLLVRGTPSTNPCISTFLAETRSSTPFDSRLKDFTLGSFQLCGTKRGMKFHDRNANGTRDSGEEGLNGWKIKLFNDVDGSGDLSPGDTLNTTATTHTINSVDGSYEFPNIPNGKYVVCEEAQYAEPPAGSGLPTTGWNQSAPVDVNDVCDTSDPVGAGLAKDGYAITMTGADDNGNDFGNFQQGTKSGTKYNDLNANGTRDSGEPGLQNWEIRAYRDDGAGTPADAGDGTLSNAEATATPAATVPTDANGDYSLSLNPGKYVVCEVAKDTWTQSEPSNSKCAANPDLGDGGYAITVTSGSRESGNDFGNFQNATISGTKFKDANDNNARDAGEPGLGGWEIHLFGMDGMGNDVHRHTTTAADGTYSFTGVTPGSYTLCETTLDALDPTLNHPGWIQTFPTTGPACAIHMPANETLGLVGHHVTAVSGGTHDNNDFGNTPQSRVTVTFASLADLPDGTDATHATSISCVDEHGDPVGSVDNANQLTTDRVQNHQSPLTCTIRYEDP